MKTKSFSPLVQLLGWAKQRRWRSLKRERHWFWLGATPRRRDLSLQHNVHQITTAFGERHNRLDVQINDVEGGFRVHRETAEGIEPT